MGGQCFAVDGSSPVILVLVHLYECSPMLISSPCHIVKIENYSFEKSCCQLVGRNKIKIEIKMPAFNLISYHGIRKFPVKNSVSITCPNCLAELSNNLLD